jgi:hypothetical protein
VWSVLAVGETLAKKGAKQAQKAFYIDEST